MSKKTRLEKRSSFKKGGMVALMGMSLFPFNPQLASATLFNDPTAADSAFAPVPGRIAKQKNDTYGKSGSATLGGKGQKRIGAAALTGIRNDVSNMVTNVSNDISTRIESNNTQIIEQVQTDIIASQREVISTVQASLGDSAPIIHEFTSPVSNRFVQTMPYDGFVVMTVVGAGSGGNAGYNFVAGLGGNAGQFINEKKVAVSKGQSISVTVGTGGAGANVYTGNPQAGGGSLVLIGSTSHAAAGGAAQTNPRQASCPPGAVGVFYRTNNPGDGGGGCSGGFGAAPVDSSNIVFPKAVKGTGGGATRGDFYWRSGTMALLSGQPDAKFGAGGGGGAPAMLFVPSRGFSQDPINGDGGPGGYSTPGSRGADGYIKLRIYDPNALITSERLNQFVAEGGASDFRINMSSIIDSTAAANKTANAAAGTCQDAAGGNSNPVYTIIKSSTNSSEAALSGLCVSRFGAQWNLSLGTSPIKIGDVRDVITGYNSGCSYFRYSHKLSFSPVYEGAKIASVKLTAATTYLGASDNGQCNNNGGDGD